MRILAIMLALVLVLGQKPTPQKTPIAAAPVEAQEIWHLNQPEASRVGLDNSEAVPPGFIILGPMAIPITDFEPTRMPKISEPRTPENPEPLELWNLTLREAIRIGLENSEIIRMTRPPVPVGGCDVSIAPVNAEESIWKFQADAMAHVRSVEMQYWSLWQHQVALEARESAVKQAEEILRRERAEMEDTHGSMAYVAEAEQKLEEFKLALVSATSDVITTERQFRNILGLAPADNRRIIVVTPPTEARVEPDWESCVREMNGSQPDMAQQKVIVRAHELQLLLARKQVLPTLGPDTIRQFEWLGDAFPASVNHEAILGRVTPPQAEPVVPFQAEPVVQPRAWESGGTFSMPIGFRSSLANTRQAQYQLLRQRATLQRITHEVTHSLARNFLEVDANHKQFTTARRLKVAAKQRLEAQKAFYEEGRITVDRLLDAVGQQADAIAQEALYLTTYNTSLAGLEEAKGTILAYDGIALADSPDLVPVVEAKDDFLSLASFEKLDEARAAVDPRSNEKTFRRKTRFSPAGLDLVPQVPEGMKADPALP